MSAFRRFFVEFRSIFSTDDLLKENEEHSNVVLATSMFNCFIVLLVLCAMCQLKILNLDIYLINIVLIRGFVTLVIPAIICFAKKGKGKYFKNTLIVFLILGLAAIDEALTYKVTLIMAIPVALSARYYNKRLTFGVAVLTSIAFLVSTAIGVMSGMEDLNFAVVSNETNVQIESLVSEEAEELEIDKKETLKQTLIHAYMPEVFTYGVIVFACLQISQSGRKMIEKQKDLSEKGARIESELNIATQIQKHMLPSTFPAFPEHKEIDIYASMRPAKEVGGDFYDMFLIDENHLAILIADVSGKGVPAALIMMTARTLIKNTALNGYSVDEVFNKVNTSLCEGNTSSHFVTSWFAIIDLKTGKMEFVNAGHNPPLIYSNKSGRYEYLKTIPNLILAAMDGVKYRKNEIVLEAGDRVFLYTDGITEATNEEKKLYGEIRLEKFLNNHNEQNVKEMIKAVEADVDSFAGDADQADDMTMLELLYKGKKGE